MSDALSPLRHVYGLEPGDPAPDGVEVDVLDEMRGVLEALPRTSPPAGVLGAVLARAAEPAPGPLTAESPVEAAVIDQSLSALDRLPRPSPPAPVLEAVLARAAEATESLVAVRYVYAEGAAPTAGTRAAVEVEALRSTRQAVERSVAGRPQARPAASVVDAVLARAAEASGPDAVVPAQSSVEEAVVAQSLLALDRLPRPAPSAAALDAVRVAAAEATASAARAGAAPSASPVPPAVRRAADRSAASGSGSARRRGLWAGASTLALVALLAVVFRPTAESEPPAAMAEAAVADRDVTSDAAADLAEPEAQRYAPAAPEQAALPPVASVGGGVAIASASGPALAASAPAPEPRVRTQAPARQEPALTSPAATRPAAPPTPPPAWEAPDDVRALSLRLQTLDDEALAWDEPAEAFGAPAPAALTGTPGVQAVRSGAPARARVLDSPIQR